MCARDNSTSEQVALSVSSLCKTYSKVVAVEQVSFEVHRREVVGLLGPNGAGKTTTNRPTPLTTAEYILGLVITSVGTSAVGLAVMLVLATAVFGLSFFSLGALLVPFLLVLFGFGIALGILASARALRLGPASEWLVWPLPALLSPFVGVFYPLATLPRWMQDVGHLLPPSYVFEGMRAMLAGRPFSGGNLAIGAAIAALDILLAGYFFSRVFRYAIRTGLLARCSAQSAA